MGVLLVVLGLFCAPAAAARAAGPTAVVAKESLPTRSAAAEAQALEGREAPGCGKGGQHDAEQRPASPPRPSSAYELLPALVQAHGTSGSWGEDQAVLGLNPVRGPPELEPPSPVDLSILRV
ncbi:hypothetical protein CP970_22640 [Streptomyces kanamyceticus]|uniref:Uncharacterized protein n=1 Tax=Streptomyces kanamyceticus TaxID=1967 RepID=A0A5J6GJP3_STRKN|nr:hypothetical protein CP970_22640 [Streptomyces kanamyceticus]